VPAEAERLCESHVCESHKLCRRPSRCRYAVHLGPRSSGQGFEARDRRCDLPTSDCEQETVGLALLVRLFTVPACFCSPSHIALSSFLVFGAPQPSRTPSGHAGSLLILTFVSALALSLAPAPSIKRRLSKQPLHHHRFSLYVFPLCLCISVPPFSSVCLSVSLSLCFSLSLSLSLSFALCLRFPLLRVLSLPLSLGALSFTHHLSLLLFSLLSLSLSLCLFVLV